MWLDSICSFSQTNRHIEIIRLTFKFFSFFFPKNKLPTRLLTFSSSSFSPAHWRILKLLCVKLVHCTLTSTKSQLKVLLRTWCLAYGPCSWHFHHREILLLMAWSPPGSNSCLRPHAHTGAAATRLENSHHWRFFYTDIGYFF
jgi:hypothetical protein